MLNVRLAFHAARLSVRGAKADPIADYDVASVDYDDFFTPVMGLHSTEALALVAPRPGERVVELACGTGHLTRQLAVAIGPEGELRSVDKSPGMLGVAQAKLAATPYAAPTAFELDGMEEFLQRQPDASADLLVCGWAVCYAKRPVRLLRDVHRVLRPGGRFLVIDTRSDAHARLTGELERLVAAEPTLLRRMPEVELADDAATVRRWAQRAGLTVEHAADGVQVLPARDAQEGVSWVVRSGAAAGYLDALDPDRRDEVLARLAAALQSDVDAGRPLGLEHTFLVVAGHRPA